MRRLPTALALAAAATLGACADPPTSLDPSPSRSLAGGPGDFVVIGSGERLPADLDQRVRAAGGETVRSYPQIGVAIVRGASADFAARLRRGGGIESVTPDQVIQWVDPGRPARGDSTLDGVGAAAVESDVPSIGDDEGFYALQWAPRVVDAPTAWNAGLTGAGVRVAILDGAIHSAHVDLAPNLDVAASRSFVPGFAYNEDVGTFWHGTHVAGIVAAADNGIGTIGIAPEATLVGVKVLHNGSGAFEWVIAGIMYAATPVAEGGGGAHVINMSLGAVIDDKAKDIKADVRELRKAIDRATRYAWQRGVTVVASTGNDGIDFDAEKTLWGTPAQNQHVLSVAATGPHGWALGATDFERPAYYTNYGKSMVDVAAPGGTIGLFVVDGVDQLCVVAGILNFCEVFDTVLSTVRGGPASTASYNWAQGTSMAAPLVSGVAALAIQQAGGALQPAQVRARLQQTATDYGKPGKDAYYGHGWVNAGRLAP